jgi:protein SCO1/2
MDSFPKMTGRPARALALAVVAIAAVAVALVLLRGGSANRSSGVSGGASQLLGTDSVSGFAGAALPAGAPAHPFTLEDQSGRRVSLAGFRGRVTVLAFLSARCGAACTLIAQQIRGALDELAQPAPVLFISVDPAGDTAARISRFLAQVSLTGRVRYLTGSGGVLRPIWRAYGVRPLSSGRSAFERGAQVMLLDRAGRERVLFGLEQLTPEGLAHDIRKLS